MEYKFIADEKRCLHVYVHREDIDKFFVRLYHVPKGGCSQYMEHSSTALQPYTAMKEAVDVWTQHCNDQLERHQNECGTDCDSWPHIG